MPQDDLVFNLQATTLLASQRRQVHTDDRLVEAFQQTDDVRLIVAEPRRFLAAKLIKRARGEPLPRLEHGTHLFSPTRLTLREPTTIKRVEQAARVWERGLERRVRALGIKRPHVVLCSPTLAGLVELPWAASVVFYTHDDLTTGDDTAPWHEAIAHSYDQVRVRGRAMASVAQVMLDRVATTGPTAVIPNGVDVEPFVRRAEPAAALANLPRPLGVYVGTLEGRIDPLSLEAVSRALGTGSIALVGNEVTGATRAFASKLPGVHFIGPVAPEQVPSVLAAADVGLVPHVVNDVTVGMSPLKIYEYVAAGLPVVATDLAPMRGISDRVVLSAPGDGFEAATRAALALGRSSDAERQTFGRANAWTDRSQRLLQFCRDVAAAR